MSEKIFIGTDSGATTTKFSAVWENGEPVSTKVLQRPTNSQKGRAAVISGWIAGIGEFLAQNNLQWPQVAGVGPGDSRAVRALRRFRQIAEPAREFFRLGCAGGLQRGAGETGRPPAAAGRGQRRQLRRRGRGAAGARPNKASVLMLMPGSGLGAAFVGADGLSLDGDTLAGMEAGHMPVPMQLLGLTGKPFPCGCGRDWGCVEAYTTISGLPYLLAEKLLRNIPTTNSPSPPRRSRKKSCRSAAARKRATRWRLEIFDFQARVMGLHVANLTMALDPGIVVIGGGLMDHEATTPEFRERYLRIIREAAPALSLAAAARHRQDCSRRAGRTVAGHRRGAGRAVSQPEDVKK